MIVKLEENLTLEELEVLIRYAAMDGTVQKLETLIRSVDKTIKCSLDNTEVWIPASDIYYIESVDKHTFVYGKKTVYRCEHRLYQLLDILSDVDFVQVSKACIINLNVLECIKPLLNSRLEATLSSGDRITVTRKYIFDIRKKLEGRSTL